MPKERFELPQDEPSRLQRDAIDQTMRLRHMARRTGIEPVIMVRQTIVITASLTPGMEASHRFELRTIVYKTIIITNLTTRPK